MRAHAKMLILLAGLGVLLPADQPTNLQLLYYCLYWFIVIVLMVYKWYNGTLTDRRLAEMPSIRANSSELEQSQSPG